MRVRVIHIHIFRVKNSEIIRTTTLAFLGSIFAFSYNDGAFMLSCVMKVAFILFILCLSIDVVQYFCLSLSYHSLSRNGRNNKLVRDVFMSKIERATKYGFWIYIIKNIVFMVAFILFFIDLIKSLISH